MPDPSTPAQLPAEIAPKAWWQMRTNWSMIVGLIVMALGTFFGVQLTDVDQAKLIDLLMTLAAAVSMLLGIFYRIKAERAAQKKIATALALPPPAATATPKPGG